ncbi:MAG: hypothetical protein OEV30_12945, partial [Ignavibacteria bacterium]|nr:hypothetical protein [Ignavibacteria bacterium]
GQMRGLVVEISKGEEIFRRVTDVRGRFLFSDLRPGEWTVKVIEDDIPADLRVGTPTQVVALSPGMKAETRLELVPVQKRIRILQEGTLLRVE